MYSAAVVGSILSIFTIELRLTFYNKETDSKGLYQSNLIILRTFRNGVMRYAQLSVVYLINNPEPVQYVIYALAVPFDLRCESGTLEIITDLLYM